MSFLVAVSVELIIGPYGQSGLGALLYDWQYYMKCSESYRCTRYYRSSRVSIEHWHVEIAPKTCLLEKDRPMSLVNKRQLFDLFAVASDAAVPLWRYTPKAWRGKLRPFNAAFLGIFIAFIFIVNWLSPFASDFSSAQSGTITFSNSGMRDEILWLKGGVAIIFASLVFGAFLVDIKDTLSGALSKRFLYEDPDHDLDSKVWWTIILLLLGYVSRMFLFSVLARIGFHAANTMSIAESGISVFSNQVPVSFFGNFSNQMLTILQNPLSTWDIGAGGSWQSALLVTFFSVGRVMLLTFLLGTFALILRNLPTIFTHTENGANKST